MVNNPLNQLFNYVFGKYLETDQYIVGFHY